MTFRDCDSIFKTYFRIFWGDCRALSVISRLVKRWSRYWSGLFRSLVTENWRFYGVWQESCSAALEINRPTKLQPTVIDFKFISLSAKAMMVCSWDTDRASLSWAESIITVDTRVLNDGGQSDNQNVGEERKIKLTKVRFFFTFSPLIQIQSNPKNYPILSIRCSSFWENIWVP